MPAFIGYSGMLHHAVPCPSRHSLEVIDLSIYPHLAEESGIVAVPTLIKKAPEPMKKLVGDLSKKDKVLQHLGILI